MSVPPPSDPRGAPPPAIVPRSAARRRPRAAVVGGAVALAAVVGIAGLTLWAVTTDDEVAGTSTNPADEAAQSQLSTLLPADYPDHACAAIPAPDGARAAVSCGETIDPAGPESATYTLARDEASLQAAFDDIVRSSTTVVCPGNIQSPGPWRRNATPEKVSGTLFCGVHQGRPTVAWTTEDDLLVSLVQADPGGSTFDQLYAWWSRHS